MYVLHKALITTVERKKTLKIYGSSNLSVLQFTANFHIHFKYTDWRNMLR